MENPVRIEIETSLIEEIVEAVTAALETLQDQHPEGPERAKFVLASHITIGAMWQHTLSSYPYAIERENILATAQAIHHRFWPGLQAIHREEKS